MNSFGESDTLQASIRYTCDDNGGSWLLNGSSVILDPPKR